MSNNDQHVVFFDNLSQAIISLGILLLKIFEHAAPSERTEQVAALFQRIKIGRRNQEVLMITDLMVLYYVQSGKTTLWLQLPQIIIQ